MSFGRTKGNGNGHEEVVRHVKSGPGFQILKNEPRVVSIQTVRRLKECGASRDFVAAAERAAKTNP
jgi:hypothetical protein